MAVSRPAITHYECDVCWELIERRYPEMQPDGIYLAEKSFIVSVEDGARDDRFDNVYVCAECLNGTEDDGPVTLKTLIGVLKDQKKNRQR